ncbi:hypothetical protein [Brevibacillus brevis]|uniref:hypothetical protein n=1 Tax=Brevibacillus brevis TaxID=1393 RepID=UPI0011595C17|nr:hypothetical protein [Lysinibacillus sp. SDF0063]TQR36303.1 hypothetical protein C7Y45_10350 [Lysinibacillus sp. SDF0063]
MPIMSILLAIILIVLLVFLYKKREETESNLGLKIVGYFWLGAFAFKVNEMPLPLGFLLFLLIFRPMTNVKTKQRSAYLGLACFLILYLISPAVERELFERPRDVVAASNNMFQIKFTNDWRTIRDQLKIDEHARLVYFKSHYQKNGLIDRLYYYVVSVSEKDSIYYDIHFSADTNRYTIRAEKIGAKGVEYGEFVEASRFFEVLDEVQVRNLSLEQPFVGYTLRFDGERIKNADEYQQKYVIQGKEIKTITNDQLPTEGYPITVCGKGEPYELPTGSGLSNRCEANADFFFDDYIK